MVKRWCLAAVVAASAAVAVATLAAVVSLLFSLPPLGV
jgi:hypothetical protein